MTSHPSTVSNDDPSAGAAALLIELDVPHTRDVPLGPRTWYGVGGRAEALAQPTSVQQLAAVMQRCHERAVPVRVLGSGANLLVADDVPGVVIELSAPAFGELRAEGATLIVGSGYDLFKLVLEAARRGLAGLEQVAGIPATVGGAVRMNAGGAFGDIGSHVQRVRVMDWTGEVYDLPRSELSFGYRHTNIHAPLILEAAFGLGEDDPDALMRRVKETFFYKKTSQPMGASSAGCAFKNPPKDAADGAGAGALIDRAGLKGHAVGKARVSEVHANFIVAEEGAAACDVLAVIEHVQETVAQRFGVQLEREVVVWP
ncbi:MAG: UDP-N-acetylmuramate dehydrogenase [Phycisphaeraceae bacterium]